MRFLKYFVVILAGITINHFTLLYKTKKSEKSEKSKVAFSENQNLENIHKSEINSIPANQSLEKVSGEIKSGVFTYQVGNEWVFKGFEIYSYDMFSQALKYTGKENELFLILEKHFNKPEQTIHY